MVHNDIQRESREGGKARATVLRCERGVGEDRLGGSGKEGRIKEAEFGSALHGHGDANLTLSLFKSESGLSWDKGCKGLIGRRGWWRAWMCKGSKDSGSLRGTAKPCQARNSSDGDTTRYLHI